jgi:hypothetical protein
VVFRKPSAIRRAIRRRIAPACRSGRGQGSAPCRRKAGRADHGAVWTTRNFANTVPAYALWSARSPEPVPRRPLPAPSRSPSVDTFRRRLCLRFIRPARFLVLSPLGRRTPQRHNQQIGALFVAVCRCGPPSLSAARRRDWTCSVLPRICDGLVFSVWPFPEVSGVGVSRHWGSDAAAAVRGHHGDHQRGCNTSRGGPWPRGRYRTYLTLWFPVWGCRPSRGPVECVVRQRGVRSDCAAPSGRRLAAASG